MFTDACSVVRTCPPEKLLLHRTKLHLITLAALIEMSCSRAQIHEPEDQTHLQQKGCHQLAKSGNSINFLQTTQRSPTHMLNTDLNVVNGAAGGAFRGRAAGGAVGGRRASDLQGMS